MDEASKAVPVYAHDCQGCILCILDCPREAIRVVFREDLVPA